MKAKSVQVLILNQPVCFCKRDVYNVEVLLKEASFQVQSVSWGQRRAWEPSLLEPRSAKGYPGFYLRGI